MDIDAVVDLGWGSSGKGGLCGYLAKHKRYDVVMCAYPRQAGHTYNDGDTHVMVQQLPVGIIGRPSLVFIGPGAIIHRETIIAEMERYAEFLTETRIMIHESAAVVTDDDAEIEIKGGMAKIGSTTKGVGQAMINRILRSPDPKNKSTAGLAWMMHDPVLCDYVVTKAEYDWALSEIMKTNPNVLIEGSQGFGLSLYHGDYPFCTSRDVTPAQLFADVGLPRRYQNLVKVHGVTRTRPIRVNNRDGYSGPCYPDQKELSWKEVGVDPERTTVTKLERRIFSFSKEQMRHAAIHCLTPLDSVALSFCDYIDQNEIDDICDFFTSELGVSVEHTIHGPDVKDVKIRGTI